VFAPAVAELSAAGATTNTDLLGLAVANGPLGILCLALAYGWKRERDRGDRAVADKDRLVESFLGKVVPALEQSTAALERLAQSDRKR
jgi:hypothetical protein